MLTSSSDYFFEKKEQEFLEQFLSDHELMDIFELGECINLPMQSLSINYNKLLNSSVYFDNTSCTNKITFLTRSRQCSKKSWLILPFGQTIQTICSYTGLPEGYGKYIRAAVFCYMTGHYNPEDFFGNKNYELKNLKFHCIKYFNASQDSLHEESFESGFNFMSNYSTTDPLPIQSCELTLLHHTYLRVKYPFKFSLENNSKNLKKMILLCKNVLFSKIFNEIPNLDKILEKL